MKSPSYEGANNTSVDKGRIAIARTFCEVDAMNLVSSFDVWDKFPPCQEKPLLPVDLVISFSRALEDSPVARLAVEETRKRFEETQGWNQCFERFIYFGTNIPADLDVYDAKQQNMDANWVNGPNRQFERTIRMVEALGDFELMYLMEGDSVPQKKYWLDAITTEINEMRPFAVLGSTYRGDKWDSFYNKIPSSLIHHTNGNAVYNITHRFFLNLLSELESEANTAANNVAFDHRMQQIIQEGVTGVASKQVDFLNVNPLPENTAKFQNWVDQYPPETVIKESVVNGNYAATNIVSELLNDDVNVIHGAKMYKSWDCSKHGDITLVVSDWSEGNSRQMISSLSDSKHPFSRVLIMQPDGTPVEDTQSITPKEIHYRGSDHDTMDFCNAPVTTDWFMITNSYFRSRPIVTIMVEETKKNGHFIRPIVSTVDADDETCFSYDSCVQDLSIAHQFLPNMKRIFQSDNILFNTLLRDKFCEQLKMLPVSNDLIATPATAYMAFLEAQDGGIRERYKLSDRRKHGSRFHFVPLHADSLPPVMANEHRRQRQLQAVQSNETECTNQVTAVDCDVNGCNWNPDFGSCRDTPSLDDNVFEENYLDENVFEESYVEAFLKSSNAVNSTESVVLPVEEPKEPTQEWINQFGSGNPSVSTETVSPTTNSIEGVVSPQDELSEPTLAIMNSTEGALSPPNELLEQTPVMTNSTEGSQLVPEESLDLTSATTNSSVGLVSPSDQMSELTSATTNSTKNVVSPPDEPLKLTQEAMDQFAKGNASALPEIFAAMAEDDAGLETFLTTLRNGNSSDSAALETFMSTYSDRNSSTFNDDFTNFFGNATNFEAMFGNTSNFLSLLGYNPVQPTQPNGTQQLSTLQPGTMQQLSPSLQPNTTQLHSSSLQPDNAQPSLSQLDTALQQIKTEQPDTSQQSSMMPDATQTATTKPQVEAATLVNITQQVPLLQPDTAQQLSSSQPDNAQPLPTVQPETSQNLPTMQPVQPETTPPVETSTTIEPFTEAPVSICTVQVVVAGDTVRTFEIPCP